ncbi:MAG: terminase family protein [Acidobacteria bacterium]|nr:terminase family protein [Acidobacteriota bacterium]
MGRLRGRGRQVTGGLCSQNIGYHPLPSQRSFHLSKARFKGFSGPIGSGKSQALCHEAIRLSYLNTGRMGLLGAPTYPMLRDATQVTLFEILRQNAIPYDFNKSEGVVELKDIKSRMILRAVDEFERLRGSNLAWFGVDELTYAREESWVTLEGRLRDPKAGRLCGFAVWTPKGYDWVYRRFIKNRISGYETTMAKPFENRYLLSAVPDFYERLKGSYDAKFYEQEVRGEYLSAGGSRVYDAFDRRVNVREMAIDRNRTILWALDFNVDPMSSVIAQVRDGEVYVLEEQSLQRVGTWDACARFYELYGDHPSGVEIFADATGSRMQTTGTSDHQVIRDFFTRHRSSYRFRVGRSNPPVRDRVRLVNQMLRDANGETRLFVAARCRGLIRDFEEVRYRSNTSEIDKTSDSSLTHLADAVGYLLWEEFGVQRSVGEKTQRLL